MRGLESKLMPGRQFQRRISCVSRSLLCALLLAAALYGQQSAAEGVTADRLTALGRLLSEEVERRETVLHDGETETYLAQLSERLGALGSPEVPLSLRVLARPDPWANALPGGPVYLSAGLILRLRSEAELAALMVHQAAHIRLRHGLRVSTQRSDGTTPVPLVFLGGWNGVCARFASGPPYPVSFRAAAAEFERQADEDGRARLANAGFDPAVMSQVFEWVGSGSREGMISPDSTSPEFERLKLRLRALLPSASPPAPSLFQARNR